MKWIFSPCFNPTFGFWVNPWKPLRPGAPHGKVQTFYTEKASQKQWSKGNKILDVFFFTIKYHISFVLGFACFHHHPTPPQHHPENPNQKKREGFRMFVVGTYRHLIWIFLLRLTAKTQETQRFEKDAIWTRPTLHCVYIDPHRVAVSLQPCCETAETDVNKNKMLQPTCDLICGSWLDTNDQQKYTKGWFSKFES